MKKTVKRSSFRRIVEYDDTGLATESYGDFIGQTGGKYVFDRATGTLIDPYGNEVYQVGYDVHVDRNHFEYFAPAHQPKKKSGKPSKKDIEYMLYNWKDAEAINSGDVVSLFIRAAVDVPVAGVVQTIESGGVGGVDVRSIDDDYVEEIYREEAEQLEDILVEMGFKVV